MKIFSSMRSMFKSMETMFDDIEADFDELLESPDLGPLPDGVTEEKTVEEVTKPDGTRVIKTITRRVIRSTGISQRKPEPVVKTTPMEREEGKPDRRKEKP